MPKRNVRSTITRLLKEDLVALFLTIRTEEQIDKSSSKLFSDESGSDYLSEYLWKATCLSALGKRTPELPLTLLENLGAIIQRGIDLKHERDGSMRVIGLPRNNAQKLATRLLFGLDWPVRRQTYIDWPGDPLLSLYRQQEVERLEAASP